MRKSHKRLMGLGAIWSLGILVALGSMGCEQEMRQADRQVLADLERSRHVRETGGERAIDDAQRLVEQAAAGRTASPATRAHANAMAGDGHMVAASAALRQVAQHQREAVRLIWEMGQLLTEVELGQALGQAYRHYRPDAALEAVQRQVAEARGTAQQQAWITHDQTELPTLVAARQEVSRLEGEIATAQQQIEQLQQQRQQVVEQAEAAAREAEAAQGEAALGPFARASDLRRQAEELSIQIEAAAVQLDRLEGDLAVVGGQQRIIGELIADLEQLQQQIQASWGEIEQRIAMQAEHLGSVLSGEGLVQGVGRSLAQKADELSEVLAELAEAQDLAERSLTGAIRSYQQAGSDAEAVSRELRQRIADPAHRDRPEREAWQVSERIFAPAHFRRQEALAQQTLATYHAGQADTAGAQLRLAERLEPVLGQVGFEAPQVLRAAELRPRYQEHREAAIAAYEQADQLLENITEAPARVARMFVVYGRALLAQQAGDVQAAQQLLQEAIALRDQALEEGAQLPALPPELAAAPRPAARGRATPGRTAPQPAELEEEEWMQE